MNDFCPFLEIHGSASDKCCAVGVNFFSVGADRALCRVCQLSDLGEVSLCPNAEVYTFLRNSGGSVAVTASFACLADHLPDDLRCHGCPGRSVPPLESEVERFAIPTRDRT